MTKNPGFHAIDPAAKKPLQKHECSAESCACFSRPTPDDFKPLAIGFNVFHACLFASLVEAT